MRRPLLSLAVLLWAAAWLPPWGSSTGWLLAALLCLVGTLLLPPKAGRWVLGLALLCLASARLQALEEQRGSTQAWMARPRPALSAYGAQRVWIQSAIPRERFEGVSGWVEEGACIQIASSAPPARWARGPIEREPLMPWLRTSQPLSTREFLPDECVRLAPPAVWERVPASLVSLRERARQRLASIEDPAARGLVCALLLGDTRELAWEDQERFVRTGIYHLLVVSGTQVALLSALFFLPLATLCAALLRALIGRAPPPSVLTIFLVLLYVPLAGACAPVVRAAVVWCAGQALCWRQGWRARADPLSLWAAALVWECCLDPLAPLSVSVQLSYGATLGLILGTRAGLKAWEAWRGPAGCQATDALGRARSEVWVACSARWGHAWRTAWVSSLVASVATLPWMLAHWGEFAPFGVIATVLCAPLAALLLIMAASQALLGLSLPTLCYVGPTQAIAALAQAFDAWPLSPWCAPERALCLWFGLSALCLWALRARSLRALRGVALLLGALLLPWQSAPSQAQRYALEVGHGSALLSQELDGRLSVFDAGSRERRALTSHALGPLLAHLDAPLERVVLSHTDADHSSALSWLVERYPPRLYAGPLDAECVAHLPRDCARIDLDGVGRLALDAKTWLLRGQRSADNEGSRSLCFLAGGEWHLWLGDAEDAGLRATLRALEDCPGPFGTVLLPHHGADSPQLARLLQQVQAREWWLSAGPRAALQAEWSRREWTWRWTERDGPLVDPRPP